MDAKNKNKVICAMSGGLDSSVAAALLKKQGYSVVGVFMKFWHPGKGVDCENRCCSTEAESRARKVAKILKIPFYVFNFEKEFKKRIVDYFLTEHKKGVTPNPCVVCNKEIKFGLLLEKALELDADYIATGHYARKKEVRNKKQGTIHKLLKAKDKNKDQSYFLWKLDQNQLKRILFPISDYTREEVLSLAKKFKLSFLVKIKKSQEICFIPTEVNEFLEKYLKEKSGKIVDATGKIIGEHKGLWFYTIGQRKGIGLPAGPYYVLNKDKRKNILTVTKNEKDLYKKELIARNINWISGREPRLPLKVQAKIRYRHRPASVKIHKLKTAGYKLTFNKPQRAVTPGQSVVFYKGQEVLGGGIIV